MTGIGLLITLRAANAAKASADIADRSLRVLNQPWLDTADWHVVEHRAEAVAGSSGFPLERLTGLSVTFNVVNNSRTPATLYQIEMTDSGSGDPATVLSVSGSLFSNQTSGSSATA